MKHAPELDLRQAFCVDDTGNSTDDHRRPNRFNAGRPSKVSSSIARQMLRDRERGASWDALSDLYGMPRSTVREIVRRRRDLGNCLFLGPDPEFSHGSHSQNYPLRSVPEPTPAVDPATEANSVSTKDDSAAAEVAGRRSATTASVHVETPKRIQSATPPKKAGPDPELDWLSEAYWPAVRDLQAQLAGQLSRLLDDVLAKAVPTHYPVAISVNPPPRALLEWPARQDLVTRHGFSISKATSSWQLIDPAVMTSVVFQDATAAMMSIDISDVGRPHFYGWAVFPVSTSMDLIADRIAAWTGADRRAIQVGKLWRWDPLLEHRHSIAGSDYVSPDVDHEAYYRRLLGYDIEAVISYTLKGADRSAFNRQMPPSMPAAIWSKPARDFIVYSRGISITADVGRETSYRLCEAEIPWPVVNLMAEVSEARCLTHAEASLAASIAAESERRNRLCASCGELVSPVRPARVWNADSAKRPKVRRVRIDRATCNNACKTKLHRDWALLTQAKLDAVAW